jgi:hypothetical protein
MSVSEQDELQYIKEKVKEIEQIGLVAGDDESAHYEDDLLRDHFITLVAKVGSPELIEMAEEILKTNSMNFSRWYA